jgi:hypothetical protein
MRTVPGAVFMALSAGAQIVVATLVENHHGIRSGVNHFGIHWTGFAMNSS